MRSLKIACFTALILSGFFLSLSCRAYTDTMLRPATWEGGKWEYLVEHPRKDYIDAPHFNEILDTKGLEGWELIAVTHYHSFFAFYFKRPLHPHRLDGHMARLKRVKSIRSDKEAGVRDKIETTLMTKHKTLVPPRVVFSDQPAISLPAKTTTTNKA